MGFAGGNGRLHNASPPKKKKISPLPTIRATIPGMDTPHPTVTVRLPKVVIRTLKIYAARQDYGISDVVARALELAFRMWGVALEGGASDPPQAAASRASAPSVVERAPADFSRAPAATKSVSRAPRSRADNGAPPSATSVDAQPSPPTQPVVAAQEFLESQPTSSDDLL